jgi:opacity protein-like surface antigen
MGFYVGGSVSCCFVMPSLYWTNIVRQHWMENNKARMVGAEGWYASGMASPPELPPVQQRIESMAPEVLLLKQLTKYGIAGSLYFGGGKVTSNRFYYGGECKVILKNITEKREETGNELLNADDEFIVYLAHKISGKVTYSMNLAYHKKFETSFSFRLGYFATNRLLGYVRLGTSVHRNTYDELRINTAHNLTYQRFDDDTVNEYWNKTFIKTITPTQYSTPKYTQHYMAINLGTGVDFFLTRKLFARLEYEYKISISSKSNSLSDANPEEDIYKAFGLRYQDKEHCVSFGLGVYL